MTPNFEQEAVKLRGKICCCNDPQSDEAIAQDLRAAYEKGRQDFRDAALKEAGKMTVGWGRDVERFINSVWPEETK